MRSKLRLGHYSRRTEQAYVVWVIRFVRHHGLRHPAELAETDVMAFLRYLAEERRVAAATQGQALAALLFLYRQVLGRSLRLKGWLPRARTPTRLSVVLTRSEVAGVLGQLEGGYRLVGTLLYGSGMRLLECLTLRVKDVDLERGEILIRRGKGGVDRVTVLPEAVRSSLAAHLGRVRAVIVRRQPDIKPLLGGSFQVTMEVPVRLKDILEGMEFQSDEITAYLHRPTGRVIAVSDEALQAAEEGASAEAEVEEFELADARGILEGGDDYLALPDRFEIDEYRMMERFAAGIADPRAKAELTVALQGRGAFRRFKLALDSISKKCGRLGSGT